MHHCFRVVNDSASVEVGQDPKSGYQVGGSWFSGYPSVLKNPTLRKSKASPGASKPFLVFTNLYIT
jgi:hypothetical protein